MSCVSSWSIIKSATGFTRACSRPPMLAPLGPIVHPSGRHRAGPCRSVRPSVVCWLRRERWMGTTVPSGTGWRHVRVSRSGRRANRTFGRRLSTYGKTLVSSPPRRTPNSTGNDGIYISECLSLWSQHISSHLITIAASTRDTSTDPREQHKIHPPKCISPEQLSPLPSWRQQPPPSR